MIAIECPVLPGYFFTRAGLFSVGTADGPFFRGYPCKIGLRIYRRIFNNGTSLLVHRMVAFTFCPNPLPTVFVVCDHINGNTEDNRVENLRWVTQQLNLTNSSARCAYLVLKRPIMNGGKRIWIKNKTPRWKSMVTLEGHQHLLGHFKTEEEACQCSRAFRRRKFEEIYKRILKEHAVEGKDSPPFDIQPLRAPRSAPRDLLHNPTVQRTRKDRSAGDSSVPDLLPPAYTVP